MPKKPKNNRESKKNNCESTSENKNLDKEKEIEELVKEKDSYYAMAQRSQADLVNYKKRASEEKEEIRKSTNFFMILKILPIIDDFDRAISIIPDDSIKSSWGEGLVLVQRNFINTLDTFITVAASFISFVTSRISSSPVFTLWVAAPSYIVASFWANSK